MYTMKYYKNTLRIVAFLLFGTLYAQQEPNYSLYRYTMNVINPAYAGVDGKASLTSSFRSQWIEVDGAPETQSFFFSTPMGKKVGLGASIVNDKTFIENQTSFNIDFSYLLTLNETTNLYLGLKAGGSTYNVDTGRLNALGTVDPALNNIDTGFRPNVGIGGYLVHEKYFVSLSMPRLLLGQGVNNDNGNVTFSNTKTHVFLSGGYNFDLSSSVEFRPSVMIRYVSGAPVSMDYTAAFRINERFELGAALRTDGAITGLFMFNLADWMDLGYAYDSSIRDEISGISEGTHEVLLRFNFLK